MSYRKSDSSSIPSRRKNPTLSSLDSIGKSNSVFESDAVLMERAQSKSTSGLQEDSTTLEETILENLDSFLAKIERSLETMETLLSDDPSLKSKHSTFFDTLTSIKNSMIAKHERSLHPLSEILNDYYGPLLSSYEDQSVNSDSGDAFYMKVLRGLHFLDEKMNQVERALNISNPENNLRKLGYTLYNYEKALVAGTSRLLNFYELPFQWRENKFIIFGYRFNSSHSSAIKSICQIHNETANIWTHLTGVLTVVSLILFHYPSTNVYAKSTTLDRSIMYIFFFTALECLISSVIWHTYAHISTLTLRQRFACIDYTGITVLITGSILTTEHIALRDYSLVSTGFMTFSFVAGIIGILFTWSPFFDKPESRPIRIFFFISLAGLGVSAFFSVGFLMGFGNALKLYFPLLRSFVWYGAGVVFYGALIPERWRTDVVVDKFELSDDLIMDLDRNGILEEYLNKKPELTHDHNSVASLHWVDYILNSHNIWHIFVLLGVIGHYSAILEMFSRVLDN